MEQLTGQDPTHIGPYRLIARLGEGGMGLVYLGRSDLGRTVAVKVVQAEHAQHPEFRRRFTREVAAARRVGGDWTAAVLDADTEAAVPWVATQYIPGPDLTTVVGKDFGPLPEDSVHVLANRLAIALRAVHEAGLIHRDLKPSNVLVTVDGPRVIDFGIARALDSIGADSLLTRTGMLIGSPGFMSPEQVRGHELTPANDMFCLGAVLVYAATGRLLFGATDTGLNAHLFRIAEEEPDLTGVPESLLDLVRACLSKDPTQRPTPAEVIERTVTDRAEEWLPGSVLAQLGRKAAELLDFAPEQRGPQPDPRARTGQPVAPPEPTSYPLAPSTPPPAYAAGNPYAQNPYAPTTPAGFSPAPGYGPPGVPMPGVWPPVPRPSDGSPHGRRWWALAMATLAQLVVLLDASSSSVLLHDILADTQFDSLGVRWLLTGHALAFGALLLVGGHLADLVGRKTTLLIGLSGFAVATAVRAAAGSAEPMIWGHILQGVFAALVASASLALVGANVTEPGERRKAYGIYALVGVGGSALSLFLAVPLAQAMTWRAVMYVTVALALIAIIGTAALVRDQPGRTPARFDALGALLGTLGVGALVYGLHRIVGSATHTIDGDLMPDWGTPAVLFPLACGIIMMTVFFWRQSRSADSILPPYETGNRNRLGAMLALLFTGLALAIVVPLLGEFLMSVGGGLALAAFVAMTGFFLLGSLVTARLLPRVGPGAMLVPGLLVAAVGVLLIQLAMESASGAFPSMICLSLGLGMAGTVLYSTATDGTAPHDSGGRAGLVVAHQAVGASLGLALFGTAGGWVELRADDPAFLYQSAGGLLVAALVGGLLIRGQGSAGGLAPGAPDWSAATRTMQGGSPGGPTFRSP
ncbi:bifunctional serine/threonine protein kinase/MFS transporter [Streptomyces sp. NBC_01304]|uniref:bifunctional serine/threonine protein kinase/MFS transporter n=1 Tax=Streptomyces sp. NBC_01304 TaxID=2903818 RepID=UPI002E100197|nr:MFS transporter [Streptomyces sp. NBC_01304]